jgi:hypothetical protein
MTGRRLRTALWSGALVALTVGGQSMVRGQQAGAAGNHIVLTSQQDC